MEISKLGVWWKKFLEKLINQTNKTTVSLLSPSNTSEMFPAAGNEKATIRLLDKLLLLLRLN